MKVAQYVETRWGRLKLAKSAMDKINPLQVISPMTNARIEMFDMNRSKVVDIMIRRWVEGVKLLYWLYLHMHKHDSALR